MSIKNEDRHGLANLQHERVKPFDKAHISPIAIIFIVLGPIAYFIVKKVSEDEESLNQLHQRNIMLAMKKT